MFVRLDYGELLFKDQLKDQNIMEVIGMAKDDLFHKRVEEAIEKVGVGRITVKDVSNFCPPGREDQVEAIEVNSGEASLILWYEDRYIHWGNDKGKSIFILFPNISVSELVYLFKDLIPTPPIIDKVKRFVEKMNLALTL